MSDVTATSYVVDHDAAVNRGVALLDERLGRDVWLPRMDPGRLDVGSLYACALAQATGVTYPEAIGVLDHHVGDRDDNSWMLGDVAYPSWSEAHGFGILVTLTTGRLRDFAGLNEAWVRKIEQLRAEVAT